MIEQDASYEFVELNRTFHELPDYARESDEPDFRHLFGVGKPLDWSSLIQEYRVVLLSEAGSGKTLEIQNIAQRLRTQGNSAFFIRLEHIPDDFEDAFEVGTFEQFQDWLASGDEGWLLLDSVDEARLRSPGDFERAVRKLGRRISTAKDRTHIVITGRTTAWRPTTDLALCTRHFPFAPSTTKATDNEQDEDDAAGSVRTVQRDRRHKSPFKLVTLDDLTSDQITLFARFRGVTDTTAFLHAIERADAWSFTSRPQDLEELTEFWIDRGKIGSRLELMRNSIERRLAERDQGRADAQPLSSQEARYGATLLAASATLAQEQTIRVPDGADNSKGIPVGDVLPEWDDKKQSTLLCRPIFDEAIYGAVRLHHRSVREYLTAEWLAHLLGRETSRRKIEALFFRNQYGLDVVVPTLRPVLPWLALLDDRVRERLRKIAPEIVFEGGDPSQLPLETRRTILHEVCEQMASGTSSRSVANYDAVQRFSNADLTDDIRGLIGTYEGNDELRGFLLRMVWLGELTAALPEARAAALSPSTSTYTRIAAIRAVRAIGAESDREEIRNAFLAEAEDLRRDWLAELVQETGPTEETVTWLLSCLAKAEDKEEYSVDRLTDALEAFVQSADVELLPRLASGLNELLDKPPVYERRFCQVSQKFSWLLEAAAHAVEGLIRERHSAALGPAALAILHKLLVTREYGANEDAKYEFSTLVPAWPELNRALFWYEVEQTRTGRDRKRGERLDEYWQLSVFGAFWRFDEGDFEYVADQISAQETEDNRLVALSLAFRLYVENGRPRNSRETLKKLVVSDSALSARLAAYLKPPAQSKEARRSKQEEARWKRRSEARKKAKEKYHDNWKESLAGHVDALRNSAPSKPHQITNAQYYLHERMRKKHGDTNRWTDGAWKTLIDEYGEAVASAFRDGVVAYWRRYKPKLQSEGAPPNETPFPVIFGLTALSIEARETAGWPDSLKEDEVDLACRYASYELNGFPVWFPKLFEQHPTAVAEFLLNEIKYELSIEKPDADTHYILSDVGWSGEWGWDELGPDVVAILSADEPANLTNLRQLLTILQGSSMADDDIKALAVKKCRTLQRHHHLALWYAVWTGVDPDTAIPTLAARLAEIEDTDERTAFAMNYLTHLSGGRRHGLARVRREFQTPRHLKCLYLLMQEYIRQEDDIERIGKGVRSRGLRDDAQDARDGLFTLLNQIPGKEAFLALDEIAKVHPEESSRAWFIRHAKTKAEQDADIQPWSPSQVREFQDKLERNPANHRQLAELAVMRLLDLKDDLENGDSSIAQILQSVTQETDMRKYVGRELREKAFGRYSIPQEEELADAKKPDLRFHSTNFDGPVPVELKLADNWTGPELFERLENQLCGDYLRDNQSHRGLFVLVYRGAKTGWDLPGSANRVGFEELVAALQAHWKRISPQFPWVEDITVIGVDLTKRCLERSRAEGGLQKTEVL